MYFNYANQARDYFSKFGFSCPDLTNPADYYMSIMSKESLQVELELESMDPEQIKTEVTKRYSERIELFVSQYEASDLKNSPIEYLSGGKFDTIDQKFADNRVSWWTEFCMLSKRNLMNIARLPFIIKGKVISTVMLCIFELILYTNVGETKAAVQDRNGALFFVSMSFGFQGFNNISLVFPSERPVFLREVQKGMYRVSSYYWSKILTELPMAIVVPVLTAVIIYFAVGFNLDQWYNFPVFILLSLLVYQSYGGYGLMVGSIISNPALINIIAPVILVP